MLNAEIQNFYNKRNHPNWILMYKIKWAQLLDFIDAKNLKILDFGSGFGTTANYLAKDNNVVAIEPRKDMIELRECKNHYTQIQGRFEKLKDFEDNFFDIVICHNVPYN